MRGREGEEMSFNYLYVWLKRGERKGRERF
jgi:hypothetical protein